MEELEIDLLALTRAFVKRWIWILSAVVAGVLIGKVMSKLATKKYSSRVVFVPESASNSGQMLSNLGLLTGKIGVGTGDGDMPPFLSHFEDFLKSRNFTSSLRLTLLADSSLPLLKKWYQSSVLDSDAGFASWADACVKGTKKDGLFKLEVVTKDPLLSYYLAQAAFKTFEGRLRNARMESINEDLEFIENLVAKNNAELRRRSDALRNFMERNRSAASPELQQVEQGLSLDLKLAEEKYVLSIKELETVKIKKEKKSGNEVMIETPFLDPSPIYPVPFKLSFLGGFVALVLSLLFLASVNRKDWIVRKRLPG